VSEIDAAIGARIRERRKALGMSQADLARRLDVSYQQVAKYEAGRNTLGAARLMRVAEILACSPNQLLGFEPLPPDAGVMRVAELMAGLREDQRDALAAFMTTLRGAEPAARAA